MCKRRLVLSCAMAALMMIGLATQATAQQDHPIIAATGVQPDRDYFSEMPFENIDTLSGGLVLTFTDLALPGNAGRELRFQRTYNSKSMAWTFGVAGVAMTITDPPIPPGGLEVQQATPTLNMSDGTAKRTAWYVSPTTSLDEVITRDFWRFNRTTRVLYVPNGDTCSYEVAAQYQLRVNYCHDVFGNLTDFNWSTLPAGQGLPERVELVVTQHLDDNPLVTRAITVISDSGTGTLMSMGYDGDTWVYEADPVTGQLASADPPGNSGGWTFTYDDGLINTVTTPYQGVTTYLFTEKSYAGPETPQVQYQTRVVSQRDTSDTGDRGVTPGTWTYTYNWEFGNGISLETTIEGPSGRTIHKHGWPESPEDPHETDPYSVFDAEAGIAPLRERRVEKNDGASWVSLQTEIFKYTWLKVLSWAEFGTLEIKERKITRHDDEIQTDYKTTYAYAAPAPPPGNYHSHYHRPTTITEIGTALVTRTTTLAYQHSTSPYVIGLVTQEAVAVGTGTYTKTWEYEGSATFSTGFKTSETIYGIATTFKRDSLGNVTHQIRANGSTTKLTYEHGQPAVIQTPEYTLTRVINADGTVASETRAGRTTEYDYDEIGRLVLTEPPGANAITIDYDDANGTATTIRGSASSVATVDGFGRQITSVSAEGVVTKRLYDAEGRLIRDGYPYQTGFTGASQDIFTLIEYDALGRVIKRTNPDNPSTFSTRQYHEAGHVTLTNERGEDTVQEWHAFGDPDESRLVTLVDANGKVWDYEYNGLGQLARVIGEGTEFRKWEFYSDTNRLWKETHPESGQVLFTYDAVGNVMAKTDAMGAVTTYTYDGNDRLRTVTAGSHVTTLAYEPGSDNRLWTMNPSSAVIWRYDAVTGRLSHRQAAISSKLFTTRFEYDNNDNLTAVVHPSGRRIEHVVNAAGQPIKVWEPANSRNYATNIVYHPSGGVASYSASNGITTTIGYDEKRYWTTSIGAGPLQLTYSYDGVGNPTAIGDISRPDYGQTFFYDGLDRLTDASGKYGTASYQYDIHGNRNNAGYQYNATKLWLTNQDGVGFTYDNNGNMRTAGTATYTYTPHNQLETSTDLGVSASYTYDVDEQRISKTTGTSTTHYIHGATGELLTEWKDPGMATGRIRDYIYLGTRLLAAVARTSSENPAGGDPPPPTQTHRFATSWQSPSGTEAGLATITRGITAAARKSSHPDMPRTGLRIGVTSAGTLENLDVGPEFSGNGEMAKQAGLFLEFEVERYPFAADAEWLAVDGSASSTNDLRLYITPSGALVLKHDGGRTTPVTLWTSSAVGLNSPHTLEVRFEYNSEDGPFPVPNPEWENLTTWAQIYFDGQPVATYGATPGATYSSTENNPTGLDARSGAASFAQAMLFSPGPANGLLMNVWRAGVTAAASHGDTLDYYGSTWRTTMLEAAGPGTYSQWTTGQPDWRARSAIVSPLAYTSAVATTVAGHKISYLMESMLSRGITGTVGTVLVGVRMGTGNYSAPRAFVVRNGVETELTDLTLLAQRWVWYRVANSGWSATDTIEIGVTHAGTSTSNLNAVALVVEHNTPAPAPLTDTSARVVTVNYIGNGSAQTVDIGPSDQLPTVLFVLPANGAAAVEPLWWWDSRTGAAPLASGATGFTRVWPRKGKFEVVHNTASDSYNENGVGYVAIALYDPSGRLVIPFAISKPTGEPSYTHNLRYPQSREPASTFTPDFVFGAAPVGGSMYRGPGHVGDLTARFAISTAVPSGADLIKALGPGSVEFGTMPSEDGDDFPLWAGRVDDGTSSTRLIAVTSYVGDGTPSRNIPLNLSDNAPVFALVVPTNATAKAYRVTGDTTGRRTNNGATLASSINALGANQITVGTALNATGVTYDVWAITTGFVPPE